MNHIQKLRAVLPFMNPAQIVSRTASSFSREVVLTPNTTPRLVGFTGKSVMTLAEPQGLLGFATHSKMDDIMTQMEPYPVKTSVLLAFKSSQNGIGVEAHEIKDGEQRQLLQFAFLRKPTAVLMSLAGSGAYLPDFQNPSEYLLWMQFRPADSSLRFTLLKNFPDMTIKVPSSLSAAEKRSIAGLTSYMKYAPVQFVKTLDHN